jgi:hypothetical protein
VSVFRVDANGAALYNATFDIYNGNHTQITINPKTGLAIGDYPLYTGDSYTIDTNKAKFWVDTQGNLHIKGMLEAATGTFSGIVKATDFQTASGISMLEQGKWKPDYLKLTGLNINNKFLIDDQGNVTLNGGTIAWNNLTDHDPGIAAAAQTASNAYSAANSAASAASTAADLARRIANGTYSNGTFINGTEIYSPTIYADTFTVVPQTTNAGAGGYTIKGYSRGTLYEMFRLKFTDDTFPAVQFVSPAGAQAFWDFGNTVWSGDHSFSGANLNFAGATIRNLSVTARFA